MMPLSNSSLENRRRKAYSPRRALVRSNSSLLGSIKNFVAAPFTRLFTAPPDDFDDPNDLSGKRRRLVANVDNNVIQEDGPAPAKRMRVRSPDSSPPSSAYLDPPSSAFHLKPNYSSNNPPNRSTSTTVQDPAAANARSTVSPLRRQLSQTMSIDPSSNRSLSRDISMQSIPLYNADKQPPSTLRDQASMPPMTGRPFRMRTSLTPQPSQLQREASEPPTLSALHSNPVFVRAPSQAPSQTQESQTKPGVTTLGSLVGSQRINRPPVRQHSSLLFGTPPPSATPEAATAEKVLRELDFYKTPLVPTRIRSKMSKQLSGTSSASSVTDMFSRKHPLVLMGDHDRPRKDRKKEKAKEANQTKPYAGTGGIKKRLAKARVTPEPKVKDTIDVDIEEAMKADAPPSAPVSVPPPPPQEKDSFSVVAPAPSASNGLTTSSLRVGRAPRSHLSRPARPSRSSKFSAAFEDEDMSEESKKDLEMLEEASKRAPVFELPTSFRFPEAKPADQTAATAKEPPITSLPFSFAASPSNKTPDVLTAKPVSSSPPAPVPEAPVATIRASPVAETVQVSNSSTVALTSESSTSKPVETVAPAKKVPDFFARPSAPLTPPAESTKPVEGTETERKVPDFFARPAAPIVPTVDAMAKTDGNDSDGKVPNFFASSKLFPAPTSAATEPANSLFSTTSSEVTPVATPLLFPTTTQSEAKETPKPFSFAAPKADSAPASGSSLFGFGKQNDTSSSSSSTEGLSETEKKNQSQSFSFGPSSTSVQSSQSPFSFSKPSETQPPTSTPSSGFGFGTSSGSTPDKQPFQFGAPSSTGTNSSGSLFGGSTTVKSDAPPSAPSPFAFGQSQPTTNGTSGSLFGGSTAGTEPAKSSSPFSFGQSQKEDQPKASLFGTSSGDASSQSSSFSFSTPSTSQSTTAPFSFGNASTSNNDSSKPFSFSGSSITRPVTPPNQEQEVRMDESPTRDPKPAEPRPSLGFSFGNSTTSASLFGQGNSSNTTAPASTGFSFGTSNPSSGSNPFGNSDKTDTKPFGSSGGFGQPSSSSSFTFGTGKAAENETPRPTTASGFGTSSGSSFAFGSNSSSNPFGQPNNTGSAPTSPSTFSQTPSFTFGATSNNNSNPFGFGSPAASPATPSISLPPSFGGGSGFSAATPTTPTTSFGGGASSGGSNLFTIGSAPAPSPGGNRPMKRLPNRKTGKR